MNPLASRDLLGHWRPPQVEEQVAPRSIASPELAAHMLVMASYVGRDQGSRFVAFYGCVYYAMMRPVEVAGLVETECTLPETGWAR